MPRSFAADLSSNTRKAMVALLNQQLADAIDLKLAVKQAHWNIHGREFIAIHELFDAVAGRVEVHIDEIAERAVQLGGTAAGTLQAVGKASTLTAYPIEETKEVAHVEAVSERLKSFAASCRKAIDTADEAGDAVTTDLLTRITGVVDKDAWFVGAHLG